MEKRTYATVLQDIKEHPRSAPASGHERPDGVLLY